MNLLLLAGGPNQTMPLTPRQLQLLLLLPLLLRLPPSLLLRLWLRLLSTSFSSEPGAASPTSARF